MADNVTMPASAVKAATRDVTYSGEAAHIQVIGAALLTGSDDAKVATDVVGVSSLSAAPNVMTGVQAVGIGPGFDRMLDPSNLGTAFGSTSVIDVAGADIIMISTLTMTTGEFDIEVTADGVWWDIPRVIDPYSGGVQPASGISPIANTSYLAFVAGYRQLRLRTTSTLGATMAHKFTAHFGPRSPTSSRNLDVSWAMDVAIVDSDGSQVAFAVPKLEGGSQSTGYLMLGIRDDALAVLSQAIGGETTPARLNDRGALWVSIADDSGNQITSFGGTEYVEDAGLGAVGAATGTLSLGRASAAAPTSVSADADAVASWHLRNGSQVVNLASGGTLITVGQGTMAASLPVAIASNQTVIPVADNAGSLTVDAPVATPVYVRLSDGAANLIGQKAMAASVPVVLASDQSALAVTIAATQGVNLAQVGATTVVTGGIAGTQGVGGVLAHDAPISTTNPVVIGAHAMAAAPADVSADNDVVKLWALRNGSLVVNLAAGGTLLTQMGQTAATGNYARVTDGTTTAGVIVATTALKTDLASVAGTATVTGGVAGSQGVGGLAAHASPASGNPVYVAGRASTAVPSDVGADGDAAALWTNRSGALVVTDAPHIGLNTDPWTQASKTAQYTSTQTSAVLQAGGASEKIVVTSIQIQAGGTVAGTVQVYFGTGAYSRGTNRAIFDGEFAPSATNKPGVVMNGPFISGANGDDVLVTTSAAINPLTVTIWYYIVT